MSATTLPSVSVIMPVRNEAAFIVRSLESILAQDYPGALEVVIADGMSSDDTRDLIRSRCGDPRVKLIENPGRIAATGLNAAVNAAKGAIIVRVDGHCEVARDYVSRCVEHLVRGEAACVGGPIETVGESPMARAIAVAMSSRFGVGGSAFRTDRRTQTADTVPFPAFPRQVLDRAGPFDEELLRNQDDEYSYRLREMGERILLASDVRSRYRSRATIRSLWRQYFQYGFWKVRVLQKHPRQMRRRQFVPPLFVGSLVSLGAVAPFSRAGRVALGIVLASYILASIAASLRSCRQLPRVWVAFVTLHLAYGSGFLAGMVRFAGRWRGREPISDSAPRTEAKVL